MKRILFLAGILFAIPIHVGAAGPYASVFDLYYDETEPEVKVADLAPGLTQFVIDEMKRWHTDGIDLTEADIQSALTYKLWTEQGDGLCQGKHATVGGREYNFAQGGDNTPASCTGLLHDIESIINTEREINSLGTDLLAIAYGAEASIADEPGSPIDMAETALVLRRVWSGTGAAATPWNTAGDSKLNQLDGHLGGLSKKDLDEAILRFRHGYFRDQREADPRFAGVQDTIRDDLQQLADVLGITGDPSSAGVIITPKLQTSNVAVWIRRDDIGLLYVYPTHFPRLEWKKADQYPKFVTDGDALAYPFEYTGAAPPADPLINSPLCSRLIGKQGYLCRSVPAPETNCPEPGSTDKITLLKCAENVFRSPSGPRICPDFQKIYENSPSITDPSDPNVLDPNLIPADTAKICTPENKVVYQDDIESHACYIGFCLLQSMSGHTLIPNRNPSVINEATSPYLACIRQDPQLGLYTELVEQSPYPLPQYIGTYLVKDFQREYCSTTGNAPHPLAGFCAYNTNDNAALPLNLYSDNARSLAVELEAVQYRQQIQDLAATVAGQRAAIDQSIDVYRKVFAKLANFINQTASLILELKNAPLTKTPCPWTGPF